MLNVMLTGVGGQGTVLAAKVLAQAASDRGWQVRTAETIGMAQRGGNVVSHLRMGNEGEEVFAPLVADASANLIIAFEPGEGARVLPSLAPGGTLVTAKTAIQPITAALSGQTYTDEAVLSNLRALFDRHPSYRLEIVDDERIIERVGNRRALNMVLLACALETGCIPLGIDDLKKAIAVCVKPQFVDMNLKAVDLALEIQKASNL
ncbi:MAG: indolepyruvate oxidoreductase subunit beta [Eggerthellaceae bacterium]|jgi:indolepyruvate ferredoxin oxidoreductase beta subunit